MATEWTGAVRFVIAAALILFSRHEGPTPREKAAAPAQADELSRKVAAQEYVPSVQRGVLSAPNRAHDLRLWWTQDSMRVEERRQGGTLLELSTAAVGRAGALRELEPAAPQHVPGAVRVERAWPGVTEWWDNGPEGVEHGWTLTERPEGSSPLVLRVRVDGAQVEVEGETAWLTPSSGPALAYGKLEAHDSEGRALSARMLEDEGGLRIEVDDSDAAWPLTVDPLLTAPAWTAESNQADASFGSSVASAGDVNGDGFSDVVVGADSFDNGETDEGRAFLFLGGAAGLSASPAWTAESNQALAYFGASVASAGDVNGDGFSDVVVGATYFDNGETDEGRAFLYLGNAAGLSASPAWTAESNQANAQFGTSVASAGDVNGDGFSDVVVGAYGFSNGEGYEGRAFLFLGSAAGLSPSPAWTAESNRTSAFFGYSVASAGDVNGDGFSDVVVGARYFANGEVNEGRAFLCLGSAAGLSPSPAWTAESNQANAYFGYSVASAGDVNGDGFSDVVVGAYGFANGEVNEGRAYLYLGSAAGLSAAPAWTAESNQANATFGYSVASAGDVNGDAFFDVVVGAYLYDNGETNEGRAFLFLGGDGAGPGMVRRLQQRSRGVSVGAGARVALPVSFEALATNATGGLGKVRLEAEVKRVGAAFDGRGSLLSVPAPTGSILVVSGPALPIGGYHWRARVLAGQLKGRWLAFGGNSEAAADFYVPPEPALTPFYVVLPPRGSQTFTCAGGSGSGYAFAVSPNNSGGSVQDSGVYVAGASPSVTDTVTCADSAMKVGRATVTVTDGVSIAPLSLSVLPRGGQTFTASGGSDAGFVWTFATNASSGTLAAATGAYIAGSTGPVTDVIRVTDSLGNTATANVNVGPSVSISPPAATLPPLGVQLFTADGGSGAGFVYSVASNRSGGSVDAGRYQAGPTGGTTDDVQVMDSLGNVAMAMVTVTAAVSISPAMPGVAPGGTVRFAAAGGSGQGFVWAMKSSVSGGTVDPATGEYRAGPRDGVTDEVEVIDSLGNQASARVVVSLALVVTPVQATVPPRGAVQLTAEQGSAPYLWKVSTNRSGASVGAAGLFSAGPTGNVTDTVEVTDSLGNRARATIDVTAALSVSPPSPAVGPGKTQRFSASGGSGTGFQWTLASDGSGASVDGEGLYTAGSRSPASDVVQVTDSLGNVGTATVSVQAVAGGEQVPFKERPPVSGWACGCNSGSEGLAVLGLLWLFGRARRRRLASGLFVVLLVALPTLAAAPKKQQAAPAVVVEPPAAAQPAPPPSPAAPATAAPPPRPDKPSVAVLEVEVTVPGEKLDGAAFSEMLLTSVDGTGMFRVVSSKDIALMLGLERQKQLMGCSDDSSCMAEIASALGTDMVLVANVGRVGDTYLVSVKLIDGAKSRTVARASAQAADANVLLQAVWSASQEALGKYGASLEPVAAAKWAGRPKQEPPGQLVAAAGVPNFFGVAVGVVGGVQLWSLPGNRGSVGLQVDVTFRRARLDLGAGVVIGPNIGARLSATWALIAERFRLMLGLRGTAYPGLGLYGGGLLVGADVSLLSFLSVFAAGAAEAYPAPGSPVVVLLGTLGTAARF